MSHGKKRNELVPHTKMSKVENSEIYDIKTWIFHTMEMREITGGEFFLVCTKLISEYALKNLNRAEISEISKSKIKPFILI